MLGERNMDGMKSHGRWIEQHKTKTLLAWRLILCILAAMIVHVIRSFLFSHGSGSVTLPSWAMPYP